MHVIWHMLVRERAGEQFWVGVFGNAKLCTVEVDLMKFTEKVTERFRNF